MLKSPLTLVLVHRPWPRPLYSVKHFSNILSCTSQTLFSRRFDLSVYHIFFQSSSTQYPFPFDHFSLLIIIVLSSAISYAACFFVTLLRMCQHSRAFSLLEIRLLFSRSCLIKLPTEDLSICFSNYRFWCFCPVALLCASASCLSLYPGWSWFALFCARSGAYLWDIFSLLHVCRYSNENQPFPVPVIVIYNIIITSTPYVGLNWKGWLAFRNRIPNFKLWMIVYMHFPWIAPTLSDISDIHTITVHSNNDEMK